MSDQTKPTNIPVVAFTRYATQDIYKITNLSFLLDCCDC